MTKISIEGKVVGVTGTRQGATPAQLVRLAKLLAQGPTSAHSGDCVGVDNQFHLLCLAFGIESIGHPPLNSKLRAFGQFDITLPEKDYLPRNRDVVRAVEVMFCLPKEFQPPFGPGTWYTYKYSRRVAHRPTILIYPNGKAHHYL